MLFCLSVFVPTVLQRASHRTQLMIATVTSSFFSTAKFIATIVTVRVDRGQKIVFDLCFTFFRCRLLAISRIENHVYSSVKRNSFDTFLEESLF